MCAQVPNSASRLMDATPLFVVRPAVAKVRDYLGMSSNAWDQGSCGLLAFFTSEDEGVCGLLTFQLIRSPIQDLLVAFLF